MDEAPLEGATQNHRRLDKSFHMYSRASIPCHALFTTKRSPDTARQPQATLQRSIFEPTRLSHLPVTDFPHGITDLVNELLVMGDNDRTAFEDSQCVLQ